MAEPHLDHPGDVHWFAGYGPSPVVGPCPHDCSHGMTSVIAWGPDWAHYTLEQCDEPDTCDGGCRAWHNERCIATSPWLQVEWAERVLSRPSVAALDTGEDPRS